MKRISFNHARRFLPRLVGPASILDVTNRDHDID